MFNTCHQIAKHSLYGLWVLSALCLWLAATSQKADAAATGEGFKDLPGKNDRQFLPLSSSRGSASGASNSVRAAKFMPLNRRPAQARALRNLPPTRSTDDALVPPSMTYRPKTNIHLARHAPAVSQSARLPKIESHHLWPVDNTSIGDISSGFGWRRHPVTGKDDFHAAIDIAAPQGTAVRSTAPGKVMAVGKHPRLGKYVMIKYQDDSIGTFGHLDQILVSSGSLAEQGKIIGKVGSTGRSTGPHLDYSIEFNGHRIDPLSILK